MFANLFGDLIYAKRGRAKFKVGDKVRISKYKRKIFDKGFTPNWTEEIFVIDEILNTNPLTSRLVDLLGEKNNWIILRSGIVAYHAGCFPH